MKWTTVEVPCAPTIALGSAQGPFRKPQYHPQCTNVDFSLVLQCFFHAPKTPQKHPPDSQSAPRSIQIIHKWHKIIPSNSQMTSRCFQDYAPGVTTYPVKITPGPCLTRVRCPRGMSCTGKTPPADVLTRQDAPGATPHPGNTPPGACCTRGTTTPGHVTAQCLKRNL